MKDLSEKEKIEIIQDSIKVVAPEKLISDLTIETSVTNELALDSIEVMDMLIEIQDAVRAKYGIKEDTNIDNLLAYLFEEGDDLKVGSICKFLDAI